MSNLRLYIPSITPANLRHEENWLGILKSGYKLGMCPLPNLVAQTVIVLRMQASKARSSANRAQSAGFKKITSQLRKRAYKLEVHATKLSQHCHPSQSQESN